MSGVDPRSAKLEDSMPVSFGDFVDILVPFCLFSREELLDFAFMLFDADGSACLHFNVFSGNEFVFVDVHNEQIEHA